MRTEIQSTDTKWVAHHDPYGQHNKDGEIIPPHWGAEGKDGKTTHHTYS